MCSSFTPTLECSLHTLHLLPLVKNMSQIFLKGIYKSNTFQQNHSWLSGDWTTILTVPLIYKCNHCKIIAQITDVSMFSESDTLWMWLWVFISILHSHNKMNKRHHQIKHVCYLTTKNIPVAVTLDMKWSRSIYLRLNEHTVPSASLNIVSVYILHMLMFF